MARILVLTTDLPYFPGRMGVDFFNLRHLARSCHVGIVGPYYDFFPATGVANLEKAVQKLYLWPRPAAPAPLFVETVPFAQLPKWALRIPRAWRRWLLRRLVGISGQPDDAYHMLAILANCAPQLLNALQDHPWEGIVLIQSSLAPWMNFLPRYGAKIVYFHDVRSDYLARRKNKNERTSASVATIAHQERKIAAAADAVGFVSNLDYERAQKLFDLPQVAKVAPIPVDTDYFTPRPADWPKAERKIVLFTGHLRHPPNIDAVLYFVREIWPLIRAREPNAVFQAVGLTPDPVLESELAKTPQAELHANAPDIRPFFWNASVYVVPMRYGGGVRQKIFEAWSMRVPVVCTTMGAEGTVARSGVNCWLEDTPAQFAERVISLLASPPSKTLLDTAKTQVQETNSIPAAAGSFEKLVRSGIAGRRTRPYRLLYDLRWMKPGHAGGVEQMSYELIQAISHIDHQNDYRIYGPRSALHDWKLDPIFKRKKFYSDRTEKNWKSLVATVGNRLAESLDLHPVLTPEMQTLSAYRKMDFDMVHSTVGYIHPDLQAFPNILTIHDLQHLRYPEFFGADEWQTREQLYRNSAQRATHITCISEFTRQDVHQRYGIPLEKMTTIWNIPSRNVWKPLDEDQRMALLAGMGVKERFLFFPAHCWPHKNHARLIEAFALILPKIDEDFILVLTGRPFPADHPARDLIVKHRLESRVRHLGYRSPLEIRALYQSCFLLVFPSLFEGFGMPVAEAIIAEKPVACSNVTSLPEVAGDAALTFDPTDIHDIGGRVVDIINDPACRDRLVAAARGRKALFSARKIAVETLSLYRRVHEMIYQS